jgi:hypothetical protein
VRPGREPKRNLARKLIEVINMPWPLAFSIWINTFTALAWGLTRED